MIFGVRREDFWDPGPGFGYLRGRKFRKKIEPHLAPSFAHTKIPLAISVFDLWSLGTRYIEEGPVAPAVVASCSVPLMFHPVIMNGRVYWDGGIFNKSGIHAGDERVLCVYLESAGVGGVYERKTSFPRLHEGHKILRFTDFPRVTPGRLERGPDAHQNIFERTKRALEIPFDGNFLDA
jgi:NTE family protein